LTHSPNSLLLLLLLTAAISLPSPHLAAATTRIGLSLPLTGSAEKLARQFEYGARLALEAHNAEAREKAELFVADDGCDAEIAALASQELLAKSVQVVTGLLCNEPAYHFAESFLENGTPLLVAGAQSERLIRDREKQGFNLWRMSPGDNEAGQSAVSHFSKAWAAKPYAIVDDGTVYGRNLADTFRAGMEAAGLPPQFQDNFRPTQSTQARLVRRLQRAGTSHVFIGASAEDVAMIARNAEEINIPLEIAGGEALSIFPYFDAELLPASSVTAVLRRAEISPELPDTLKTTLEEADLQPEPYILYGYQAVQVALSAAKLTPKATTYELQTKVFDTLLGRVRFNRIGVNIAKQYRVYRWQNGAFRQLPVEESTQ